MEFLEESHPSPKHKRMVPDPSEQPDDHRRYRALMGLERELFRWWCTLVFRPEQPNPQPGGAGGFVGRLLGNAGGSSGDDDGGDSYVSPSMGGFLECLETVDAQLRTTKGPYFLDYANHPTMIDFVFASHVERMLASCAYWKGMDLRNPKDYPKLGGLRAWMDALEKHEYYLAFKSDYYTHVKDIPPQYGPGYNGVSRRAKIEANAADIDGNGGSWTLPLDDDEALQPLFHGIPLPACVLEAANISADPDGSYATAGTKPSMREACQAMAAWKLCGNGKAVASFAARGGPRGARNPRKTFGAELADPYARPDGDLVEPVDEALRVVAAAMLGTEANAVPSADHAEALSRVAGGRSGDGVASSLAYLRDRIGVPRDLPLASARYLRAYLNWAISVLE
jgi:glutathione S-transferase